MTEKKAKRTRKPKAELLPQNVIQFKPKQDRKEVELRFPADEEDEEMVEQSGGTENFIKKASFEEVAARNAEIQRRLMEERVKANKNVLKSYRIK